MGKGVNKVIIVGNVGADPEVRATQTGGQVVNLSIATSESWKDKNTGQMQERTEWHKIVFFNRLAEIVAEHVKKGDRLFVEGSLRTRKWSDQSGNDRYTTEVVASEMQMLSDKTKQQAPQQPANNMTPQATPQPEGFPEDDIPF